LDWGVVGLTNSNKYNILIFGMKYENQRILICGL